MAILFRDISSTCKFDRLGALIGRNAGGSESGPFWNGKAEFFPRANIDC